MYGLKRDCTGGHRNPPAYFDEIGERYPQVQRIDPNAVICEGSRCSPVLGGTVLYRDGSHLNDAGSRAIGEALLAKGIRLQAID